MVLSLKVTLAEEKYSSERSWSLLISVRRALLSFVLSIGRYDSALMQVMEPVKPVSRRDSMAPMAPEPLRNC